VEQKGLRGSSAARIDDKGRLKVPTVFRSVIQDQHGPDVFVTSVTGKSVLIYPMPAWLEVERRLNAMAGTHPSKLKFLTRVNYWGQTGELDSQGRVLIPAQLRQSASIEGEVRVFGNITHLEVWNEDVIARKLDEDPWSDEDGLKLAEHGV
jgi:MraZ protein